MSLAIKPPLTSPLYYLYTVLGGEILFISFELNKKPFYAKSKTLLRSGMFPGVVESAVSRRVDSNNSLEQI